jgi:hypothetical protein
MAMAVLKKQYYAPPDARSTRDRAFSRAVITQGGKTIWLAGQTAQKKRPSRRSAGTDFTTWSI